MTPDKNRMIRKPATNPNKMVTDIRAVQEFINKQLYTKGFKYAVATGNGNEFNPNLGGKARMLLGIILIIPPANLGDEDTISMTLNSEVIIDNVAIQAYQPNGQIGNTFKEGQYYPLPRPLSGSDDLQIKYVSINAHNIYPIFYLSDVAPNM